MRMNVHVAATGRHSRRAGGCLRAAIAAWALLCAGPQITLAQDGGAQEKAPRTPVAETGAGAETGKPKQGFWYKLCDKQPETKVQICFTFHEQVNVSTGRLFVSAAIRKVGEADTEHLLVVVPPNVAVRPGLQVTIDDKSPTVLKYIICQPKGCTAEGVASKDLVAQLKASKMMVIAVIDVTGKIQHLKVPLTGFEIAHAGPAVDKELYFKAWHSQIEQLRSKRQQQ